MKTLPAGVGRLPSHVEVEQQNEGKVFVSSWEKAGLLLPLDGSDTTREPRS